MVERAEQGDRPKPFKRTIMAVTEEQVTKVIGGDQYAFAEIDGVLRPNLRRFFYNRVPGEEDDLTQETIFKISRGLPRFSPRGERSYAEQFTFWSFAIARRTLYDGLRQVIKRREMFLSLSTEGVNGERTDLDSLLSRLSFKSNGPTSFAESDVEAELIERETASVTPSPIEGTGLFKKWVRENLTERQQSIAIQKIDGKKNDVIAAALGVSEGLIDKELLASRRRLEQEVLFPAGFRLIHEFVDKNVDGMSRDQIDNAVRQGRISAVKIFGKYYTSAELVQEALKNRKQAQYEAKASEGLVSLGLRASPSEFTRILRNCKFRRELLVFRNGKAFIREDDLQRFREDMKSDEKPSDMEPDENRNERLVDIVLSNAEYVRIRQAIRRGAIKAEKVDGSWTTTRAAIKEYDEEISRKGLIRTRLPNT